MAASSGPRAAITVDAGLGRGLHYYTGLIFEITAPDGLQLCGGGRYDDLISSLGGKPTPAIGFAYGLERVALAAALPDVTNPPSVVVMAAASEYFSAALSTADLLRARGYAAVVDVRDRTIGANMRDATRRGALALVICDADAPEQVRWYTLADRHEQLLRLSDLPMGERA